MSEASKRGKDFELRIAKLIRQKMGVKAARDSKSGGGWFKADIRVPGLSAHIEAKSQKTVKLSEWWSQTTKENGYKTPILMIELGGHDDLSVLRITDLLDLFRTIADDTNTITELRNEVGKLRDLQKRT